MRPVLLLAFLLIGICISTIHASLRPPSVPLIVIDPYMSVWSPADSLTDTWPAHWSGPTMAISAIARIDGQNFRFSGPSDPAAPVPNVMQQTNLEVTATRTMYTFVASGIQLKLSYITPAFPDDLAALALPITFIQFEVQSIDGKQHSVQIYYDQTSEFTINEVTELVSWNRDSSAAVPGYTVMKIGSESQPILAQKGDFIKINWGYMYMTSDSSLSSSYMGSVESSRASFTQTGSLPLHDDIRMPRACNDAWPGLSYSFNLGMVQSNTAAVSRRILFAYDEIYAINYFGDLMIPLWKHTYGTMENMIRSVLPQFDVINQASQKLDASATADLEKVGGTQYAELGSLVFRQVTGAGKLVWNEDKQETWYFLKEISSCGCLSTVDVLYPASPFYLYFNPEILKLSLLPLLSFAKNETNTPWPYPWAVHDLGVYPIASTNPLTQESMPMEESGNFLVMAAAISMLEKDASWLLPYSDLFKSWADFLVNTLPDPGNQLCTDDFEGPSPHNANLALKGVVGLAAYSAILDMQAQDIAAQQYMNLAASFALDWLKLANDTTHYRLQYNEAGTWSLKYNLLFQNILGLSVFPDTVIEREEAFYASKLNEFGVPLDNRATFTKLDWEFWVAAVSSEDFFNKITTAIYAFANQTPDRVPLTDWADTVSPRVQGFRARPVMGGVFSRLLLAALDSAGDA